MILQPLHFSKLKFLLSLLFYVSFLQVQAQKRFSIIAFGDMPYHVPADFERFKKLTAAVNQANPYLAVHVGDIKNGYSDCSDAYFELIKSMFMQFKGPLIFTPGDNDWTDCYRPASGNYNTVERLQKLRSVFYDGRQSLGKKPLPTFNQSNRKGFEKFVENQYWEHAKISFGTIHVVGSNNNLQSDPDKNQEFYERDAANLDWLDYIFDEADRKKHKGVVLFTQAAMNFKGDKASGHFKIVQKLRDRVEKFKRPVLLVYGDYHRFLIEKPLVNASGKLLTNFTSVMVFGEYDMHGVKIDIDPKSKNLFRFSEFWVDGN
ncbi:hypothetical protein AAE02nite_01410 [Adhaeribacter aerolatus]|uniref:Uncharacterized protein n=1 Tax=Adhaeribacter aerolatus TaxID=670289 RepID=A0A512ASD6_9BACT|nr:metallophosphoesterase [Adhaeribacter aerolatus]GEO02477.1 hypothetical protein AAE02nite_01410 [Adhaeribacter aerolatus]